MILDVGCGWDYKGIVNVDLFLHKEISGRTEEQNIYLKFKRTLEKIKQIPNFICADVHYLPFQSRVFDVVVCDHLLEHKGVNFVKASREMLRVAKGKLVLSVPNQFSTISRSEGAGLHDKVLSPSCFHKVFKNFKREVKYGRWQWRHVQLPFKPLRFVAWHLPSWMPCFIPTEIKAIIHK